MSDNTKQKIMDHARHQFALTGYAGLSMRTIGKDTGISPSVIYHYFVDKDELVKSIFDYTNHALGVARAGLPHCKTAATMLKQRVEFQIDHSEEIVFVLKYFLYNRRQFSKQSHGFVPPKAYLHIEEVLEFGVLSGEFIEMNITDEAKVITHAINGFILEYYPDPPKPSERKHLVDTLSVFILRSIIRERR